MKKTIIIAALLSAIYAPAQAETFQGWYGNIQGGVVSSKFKIDAENNNFDASAKKSGAIFGINFGYNWPIGSNFFAGAELGFNLSSVKPPLVYLGANIPVKERFYTELALRGGYKFSEKAAVYLRTGFGGANVKVERVGNINLSGLSSTYGNVILGVGGEFGLSDKISLRLDYNHGFDVQKSDGVITATPQTTTGFGSFPQTINFKGSIVRDQFTAGLAYHF